MSRVTQDHYRSQNAGGGSEPVVEFGKLYFNTSVNVFNDAPSEIGCLYFGYDEMVSLDFDITDTYQIQVDPQLVKDIITDYTDYDNMVAFIRFESGDIYTSTQNMMSAFDAIKAGNDYTMNVKIKM